MKNFKEIADKCLKKELSGIFICKISGKSEIRIPSKNLSKCGVLYRLKYSYPDTYDDYDENGKSTPNGCNTIINFIPDMEENDKRNIQISLQQAKEWYKSGNNTLKALALSAFSEKELNPYSRSIKEYVKNHPGTWIHVLAPGDLSDKLTNYGILLLLRKEWIHLWSQEQGLKEDWKPNWDDMTNKFVIFEKSKCLGGIIVDYHSSWVRPLSFPTRELAVNFKNTFKDLLEETKGLY